MAGDTSRICIETLKVQWGTHSSYAAICSFWTITKDQLVRLRNVVPLPLRTDRRLRYRPDAYRRPSPEEVAASEASLDLAPMVAARATCVTANWTDEVRLLRQVTKPTAFFLQPVETPEEMQDACDQINRERLW